jgi:siroheme synthase-like protein
MPRYYGVFVDVKDRRCLVFGGDPHEGERKVRYLVECGASVVLFSPEEDASANLQAMARSGEIEWIKRRYRSGDLARAWLAIVADTSDAAINAAISVEAAERNILLNVMDVTHLCTFIAPALIQRQDVTVAVSTAGTSPALARRLRERISDDSYCKCLQWADMGPILADVRKDVRSCELPVTPDDWAQSITDEMLRAFQNGDPEAARKMLVDALEERAELNRRA